MKQQIHLGCLGDSPTFSSQVLPPFLQHGQNVLPFFFQVGILPRRWHAKNHQKTIKHQPIECDPSLHRTAKSNPSPTIGATEPASFSIISFNWASDDTQCDIMRPSCSSKLMHYHDSWCSLFFLIHNTLSLSLSLSLSVCFLHPHDLHGGSAAFFGRWRSVSESPHCSFLSVDLPEDLVQKMGDLGITPEIWGLNQPQGDITGVYNQRYERYGMMWAMVKYDQLWYT